MRLRTQRLTGVPLRNAADVVAWLGAVQSQEYTVAKWSIGQRTRKLRDADVQRAYAEGDVLRTHVLRPTWHFITPADIRWMIELSASRVHAQLAGRRRQLELDGRFVARAARTIARALEKGTHLTRVEIQNILATRGIELSGERLGHLMMQLELDALVCSGAPKGRQHSYALLDERVPSARTMDRDDALAELARRYFRGHGPASEKDLARWAMLTLRDVRRAIDMVGDEIERIEVGGQTWYRVGSPPRRSPAAPRALLLQIYDEYVWRLRRDASHRRPAWPDAHVAGGATAVHARGRARWRRRRTLATRAAAIASGAEDGRFGRSETRTPAECR